MQMCVLEETNQMKIGIIGCGGIAAQHVAAYKACEDVEIGAGVDVDIQRAINVAGQDHAYTSYHEMLEQEKLDAVSVCTPPKFHKDAVCAALEAGLPVLCEKPLGFNLADAKAMCETADRIGVLLVTAFCHRFHEPVVRAKELIKSGSIGKVTMFRNRFGGKADMTTVWFSNPDISGGGTLPDTSIHSIDLFRYLVGDPIKVAGALARADQRYRVEDCSVVLVQTRDGAIGTIEASWSSPASGNVIEVYGTEGAIVVDYFKTGISYYLTSTAKWEERENEGPDRFTLQARHFVDCVRNGSKPIVDGVDGMRANEIVDTVFSFAHAPGCGWASLG